MRYSSSPLLLEILSPYVERMVVTIVSAFARSAASARLVIYPDSAHGFLFQYPDAFAKDVAAFLRRPR